MAKIIARMSEKASTGIMMMAHTSISYKLLPGTTVAIDIRKDEELTNQQLLKSYTDKYSKYGIKFNILNSDNTSERIEYNVDPNEGIKENEREIAQESSVEITLESTPETVCEVEPEETSGEVVNEEIEELIPDVYATKEVEENKEKEEEDHQIVLNSSKKGRKK